MGVVRNCELMRAGRAVLGVDARERNDAGAATEVPVSTYNPSGDQDDA